MNNGLILRHLNRMRDGYLVDPKYLKEIAKSLGARVSGPKSKVIQGCYDKIRERRQMAVDSSWMRNTNNAGTEIIATTDKAHVQRILGDWNVVGGLCARYRMRGNEVDNVGVPARYARDVMFATNRNTTSQRTRRRVYFVMRRGENIIAFAEVRFPEATNTAYLTLMCGLGGTGARLMKAIEAVSRTMGCGQIELEASTDATGRVWKTKHGFRGNGLRLVKILDNRARVVSGVPGTAGVRVPGTASVPGAWNANWTARVS